jgi:hypothetical protein
VLARAGPYSFYPISTFTNLKKRTGTEVNETVFTFPEGLNFLCHHELEREIQDADYTLKYKRIWDRLRMNSVSEGLPISNPPSMFLRIDANSIRQVNIQKLDPEINLQKQES